MTVPQLVWVNVKTGGSSPLPANISNCLACEMPSPPGTREDEIFRIAAAQLFELGVEGFSVESALRSQLGSSKTLVALF